MKPSKRDALLELARSLLYAGEHTSTTAKAGEALRTDRMRELSEAEEAAQLVLTDDPENAEAALLLAELSSLKRDWDQAILRWNAVIQRSSDREGLAYFRLAEAYRNTGSFHRARSAIQKVNPGDVDSDDLQLAKRKIGARENEVAARVVGNRYVRVLLKDRKDETARALLEAALVLRNDVSYVAQAITDVADVVEGRVNPSQQVKAAEARSAQAGEMSRCAFVCGFGWSGSGAVYDYFIQSEAATAPFGRAEVLAFERNWSAKKLLSAFGQGRDAAVTALTQLIFQGILGIGGPTSMEADKNKRKTILNFLRHESDHSAILASECSRLYLDGMAAIKESSSDRLEVALRNFFDAIMATRIEPGQVGLLGNCVHSVNIDLVRLVTGAQAFVVVRDPRDQYVSQVYEHKDRHRMTAIGFVSDFKQRIKRYETARAVAEKSNTIIPIQFEEFVLSREVREKIAAEMGVTQPKVDGEPLGYHPDDSVKNVGIYTSYPNKEEVEVIEHELADYLFTG